MQNVDIKSLAAEISELTQKNWDIVRSICLNFKIKSYFVLQPVYYVNFPIEQHSFLPKNENPFYKQVYFEYYRLMRDKNKNKNDFIDASSLFENANECPFIDSHHYSPNANKKIAELIANKMNN